MARTQAVVFGDVRADVAQGEDGGVCQSNNDVVVCDYCGEITCVGSGDSNDKPVVVYSRC